MRWGGPDPTFCLITEFRPEFKLALTVKSAQLFLHENNSYI